MINPDFIVEADDYYDEVPEDVLAQEFFAKQERAAQLKRDPNSPPPIEEYTDVEKTMDLKFISGVLHQKVVSRDYVMNLDNMQSTLKSQKDEWIKIPEDNDSPILPTKVC